MINKTEKSGLLSNYYPLLKQKPDHENALAFIKKKEDNSLRNRLK
jgi:hypothetical protein